MTWYEGSVPRRAPPDHPMGRPGDLGPAAGCFDGIGLTPALMRYHQHVASQYRPRSRHQVVLADDPALTAPRSRHHSVSEVIVARQGLPPLSGLIWSRRWVMLPPDTAQSSRSNVVPGGLKLYSCRTSSRYVVPPSEEAAS